MGGDLRSWRHLSNTRQSQVRRRTDGDH
jgi:hypothetical protein